MMAHVDLCSGIGGFALGFEWAELSKPVLFCDIEPWSRQILAKHWPDVPIAEDVKELANDPTRIIHAIGDRPSILTAGYPCQPLVKPGSAEAVKMTDTSGRKYFPLFSKSDQIGSFVKTFLGISLWASTKCFLTWQTKPITQSKHFILELYPSTPHIDVCDSGLSQEMWPTPTTQEIEHPDAELTASGRRLSKDKKSSHSLNLADRVKMWPTPIASTGGPYKNHKGDEKKIPSSGNPLATAVAMWPTPRARDWKMTGDVANWAESAIGDECLEQSGGEKRSNTWKPEPAVGRVANGIPRRWTDLKD